MSDEMNDACGLAGKKLLHFRQPSAHSPIATHTFEVLQLFRLKGQRSLALVFMGDNGQAVNVSIARNRWSFFDSSVLRFRGYCGFQIGRERLERRPVVLGSDDGCVGAYVGLGVV